MKKNKTIIFSLVIITLLVFGCGRGIYEDSKEMVAEVKTRITEISPEDLQAMMNNKEDFVLLDVRCDGEVAKGTIPGAVHISRGLLEFKITGKYPDRNTNFVLYCKKGGRGALATETLHRLKYKNVVNLMGGWEAFIKAYPDIAPEIKSDEPGPSEKEAATAEDDGGCG